MKITLRALGVCALVLLHLLMGAIPSLATTNLLIKSAPSFRIISEYDGPDFFPMVRIKQRQQGVEARRMLGVLAEMPIVYGTSGNDVITIHQNEDGSLTVTLNKQPITFQPEELTEGLGIAAGDGNDKIIADETVTYHLEILGEGGNDYIRGGSGVDYIDGGDGNDKIYGGAGDNNLFGGAGNDKIYGGDGSDYIDGGDGDDKIYGGAGDDILKGGAGNDKIYGEDGDDYIDGGPGDDLIKGGNGDDIIFGGDGNDKIYGEAGRDYIEGGNGNDYLDGGDGDDVLYGLDGDDILLGRDGNDYLDGGAGNDKLDGGNGDNILFGGTGNDILKGGSGSNLIAGGEGIDSYKKSKGCNKIYAQTDDTPGKRGACDVVEIVDLSTTNNQGTSPGSTIVINSDTYFPDFVMRVQSDIDALRSIPIGRIMLITLDNDLKGVSINSSEVGSSINLDDWDAAFLSEGGIPGNGSGTQIYYHPHKMTLYNGALDWERRPPIIGMFHEMVHAYNAGTGSCQPGFNEYDTQLMELQCVGLPVPDNGILFDNDDDPATPASRNNLPVYTENGLRGFLNLALRTQY